MGDLAKWGGWRILRSGPGGPRADRRAGMRKEYTERLSETERAHLRTLVGAGVASARKLTRARILLKANQGEGGPGNSLRSPRCGDRWSTRRGPQHRLPCTPAVCERGLDGDAGAQGAGSRVRTQARWGAGSEARGAGVQRAARGAGALDVAPAGGRTGATGGGRDDRGRDGAAHLRANALKPWRIEQGCIPEANAEFVWHMEDVLSVYQRPYDPAQPVVCLDETSRQLVADAVPPQPVAPDQPARQDYEYVRHGVCNLCLTCEPLRGWRHVTVSERRTRVDFAHVLQDLVDVQYPQADRIVLVLDQLNTHTPASLSATFDPAEAQR